MPRFDVTVRLEFPSGRVLACHKAVEADSAEEAKAAAIISPETEFQQRAASDPEFAAWYKQVVRTVEAAPEEPR